MHRCSGTHWFHWCKTLHLSKDCFHIHQFLKNELFHIVYYILTMLTILTVGVIVTRETNAVIFINLINTCRIIWARWTFTFIDIWKELHNRSISQIQKNFQNITILAMGVVISWGTYAMVFINFINAGSSIWTGVAFTLIHFCNFCHIIFSSNLCMKIWQKHHFDNECSCILECIYSSIH